MEQNIQDGHIKQMQIEAESTLQKTTYSPKINISTGVSHFLLLLGLMAEFFALKIILNKAMPDISSFLKIFVFGSVIMMLIHQFLIIRNFHILDHIPPTEYADNSIGNWVSKNRIESILRFFLFFAFAFLTGEVIYLVIVSSKTLDFLKDFINIDGDKYDLHWMTPVYVISALCMSFLMIIWDILGLVHDWKDTPSLKMRKYASTDKIVYHPLTSPYYTFIISDFVSIYFWIILTFMVFGKFEKENMTTFIILITLLFLFYLIIIFIRVIAELKVNIPRFKTQINYSMKNTYWWHKRKKVTAQSSDQLPGS